MEQTRWQSYPAIKTYYSITLRSKGPEYRKVLATLVPVGQKQKSETTVYLNEQLIHPLTGFI
jgi:hypothetical protein